FSRKINEKGNWNLSLDEIEETARRLPDDIRELHIVGGVHPDHDIHYYGTMIKRIRELRPEIHIKAFTAIELDYMIRKAGLEIGEGLEILKQYGLDSIPGGGAEIFAKDVRLQLCSKKSTAELWLGIHEAAHKAGIPSNATMLYGHIENYGHRIDHLLQLRNLQDKTGMFNAFIPLKYRKKNNSLSHIGETPLLDDIKTFAISRIFLDNIPHIKAYWPMIGKENAALLLSFGADDLDGTISDSTRIYSMAGAEEQKPSMTIDEITGLIKRSGFLPVERDGLYNVV
ncbi:MAG: CofH family radical SAM protein, partial [Bacteroidetes bacterium]|nr:CofH family radical SAM protein [Bacteroidota bacterium]